MHVPKCEGLGIEVELHGYFSCSTVSFFVKFSIAVLAPKFIVFESKIGTVLMCEGQENNSVELLRP